MYFAMNRFRVAEGHEEDGADGEGDGEQLGLLSLADEHLRGRTHMTTGANRDDAHVRGVDIDRDIDVSAWFDLREVRAGEACPTCGSPLGIDRTIEIGHIFKLGRTYTEAFDVAVAGPDGG